MNKITTKFTENLISYCAKHSIKLCVKCLLRFCEIKSFQSYKKTTTELIESIQTTLASNPLIIANLEQILTADETPNCYSCLGLLSDRYCQQICHQLTEYLLNSAKCEHQFNGYQLLISIPVSVVLRNQLLCNRFDNNFNYNSINTNEKNVVIDGQTNTRTATDKCVDFKEIFAVKDILRSLLADGLDSSLSGIPFDVNATFSIGLSFEHKESDKECQQFYEMSPKNFYPKKCRKSATKSFVNQSSILRALEAIGQQVLDDWPIGEPTVDCELKAIKLSNQALYIAGRYLKFSRQLSQTPWILDGQRLMPGSVQDVIVDGVKQFVTFDDIKFSSSGREDVDVRMLGRGRPFVLELSNPRVTALETKQLRSIMSAINGTQTDVRVRDMQVVSKSSIHSDLKEGESEKTKTYQALCCLTRPLTETDIEVLASIDDLVVQQKTPVRVLHRRTLSIREKHIYKLWAERVTAEEVDPQFSDSIDRIFKLNMTTEAGAYIKEFVHSDFGRTEPNLATILGNCSADILLLDVMDINIDWPPVVTDIGGETEESTKE